MAHQIEKNQFAYVGDAAWHGLGTQVPEGSTGEHMLTVAGLNWPVEARTIAMKNTAKDAINRNLVIPGFKAIVNGETQEVFQVASDRYQPVQNLEIVNFFREYCEAGHARMETVGALRGGAVIWALAKLNGGSNKMIGGVDEVKGYMQLATSHDGSLPTIGNPTQIRTVCANTLGMSLAAAQGQKTTYRLKHSSKFTEARKQEARDVMAMAREQIAHTNDLAEQLSRVTIDHDGWMDFMTRLMGEELLVDGKDGIPELSRVAQEIQDATIESPGSALVTARGTLWGAVNGVTWYVDHAKRSRSDSNRLFGAWFGQGNDMKTSAMRIAVEMAGVR